MNKSTSIFTIGHSNHSLEHFLSLLRLHQIQAIADVRSSPYSKFNPQFNREDLKHSLKMNSVSYVFLGDELGARRSEPESFVGDRVNFDEVAKTASFRSGLDRLVTGADTMRIALMCAEKDPLTCHRTILVARHLQNSVGNIAHILEDGEIESHAEAESRLLIECKLQNPDMFVTDRERLELAYCRRAEQIAYVDKVEGIDDGSN